MYFQTLNILKIYQVNELLICKLDTWLGTRRRAVQIFLNPLQFSIDTGIDEDISMRLFALCTYTDIDILRVKYVVECPNCDKVFKVAYNVSEIPGILDCDECNFSLKIRDEFITIYFELTKIPTENPFSLEVEQIRDDVFLLGKRLASDIQM